MDVCTIIAKNYVAFARTLAASLREHAPGVTLHVLVVDEFEGYIDPAQEPFEVLRPGDVGIPDFPRMAAIYEILELSTAVKPWLLRHLLDRSEDGLVAYLDPDIRLYGPIDDVWELARGHGVVLSPHNVKPIPRDGRKPSEEDILVAGAYNLGFIGLGRTGFAHELLDWWAERLEEHCVVDPARGVFVDQRWIDLVPGMAGDHALLRDEGFNTAYWNLATRDVVRDGDRWRVNDVPLRLFHFSGFDPSRPHLLSKHQDRIRLTERPDLARLCREYADAVMGSGHEHAAWWPYSYAETHSGIALTKPLRAAYRRATEAGEPLGSPFEPDGERALLAWCNGPADPGGEHGVTRLLAQLWASREDVRAAYPDLADAGFADGFLGWVTVGGRHEYGIPDELLPDVDAVRRHLPSPDVPPDELPVGINVVGYLRSELGVGEAARQAVAALDAARVPLLPLGLEAPFARAGHDFSVSGLEPLFDVSLVCINGDSVPGFAEEAGEAFFAGRHTIGMWWWEVEAFPDRYRPSFDVLDEIWVGSHFVANALGAVSPVPVTVMPVPVGVPRHVVADKAALGLPAGFTFLFAFDFNSIMERKNPIGLVEAFARAFAPDEDVHLVVKSINEERWPDEHDRLRMAAADHPHVHLMPGYLSAEDKERLTASCDCYVSLHRSEGFGIGMAEALLHARPVVATGYGGNTDFLDDTTGFPVRYRLVPVGYGHDPYPPDALWADPDPEHAAELMRRVVDAPAEARARAERGRERIRTHYGPEAAGARMRARLEALRAQRRERGLVPSMGLEPLDLTAPRARLARGPAPPGRSGPLARLLRLPRRAVLRALKPYTVHAELVVTEALDALGRHDEVLRSQLTELRLERAAELAQERRLRRRVDALAEDVHAVAGASGVPRELAALREELRAREDRATLQGSAVAARTSDLATRVSALEALVLNGRDRS